MSNSEKNKTEWGYCQIIVEPSPLFITKYRGKKLFIEPNKELPLTAYNKKSRIWKYISGRGIANIGNFKNLELMDNCQLKVPKDVFGQLKNISNTEYLVILETEFGENLDEETPIIRP